MPGRRLRRGSGRLRGGSRGPNPGVPFRHVHIQGQAARNQDIGVNVAAPEAHDHIVVNAAFLRQALRVPEMDCRSAVPAPGFRTEHPVGVRVIVSDGHFPFPLSERFVFPFTDRINLSGGNHKGGFAAGVQTRQNLDKARFSRYNNMDVLYPFIWDSADASGRRKEDGACGL